MPVLYKYRKIFIAVVAAVLVVLLAGGLYLDVTTGETFLSVTPTPNASIEPTVSTEPSVGTEPSSDTPDDPSSGNDPTTEPVDPSTSAVPSTAPSAGDDPSDEPSADPSLEPSDVPSADPSAEPSSAPSGAPSAVPSVEPSVSTEPSVGTEPSAVPSVEPSAAPSSTPSAEPSTQPSATPSAAPSVAPSTRPSAVPSTAPSTTPSTAPTPKPTPTPAPTPTPTPEPSVEPDDGIYLPIIKLHHLVRDGEDYNEETITESKFRSILATLRAYGFETVTTADLIAFKNGEGDLPDKPVMITFDDGYRSNYTIAYPLLQEYGAHAVISVIGWSVGRSTYLDGTTPIIPHFSWDEAKTMVDSGLVEITSHSYNLHGNSAYPGEDGRYGIQRFDGETDEQYFNSLVQDLGKMQELITQKTGVKNKLFCYPYGKIDTTSERALNQVGVVISLTSVEGMNRLESGDNLRRLKRYDVMEETDLHALMREWNAYYD